jgi:hypothetical protein
MSYRFVLSEKKDKDIVKDIHERDVGENIIFENLTDEYKVYVLYYPGVNRNEDLEGGLRNLGKITGKNLLVNISSLDDPKYGMISRMFGFDHLPVIIITAIDKLSSSPNQFCSLYVKIDDKNLLNESKLAIDCVQKLFDLFIKGEISEAIKYYDASKQDAFFSHIKNLIKNSFKALGKILENYDIAISLIEGKFELKRKSDG